MEQKEAIRIVSYKQGIKNAEKALKDPFLSTDAIQSAISDLEADTIEQIDAKTYMLAMKAVKQLRLDHAKEEGETFLRNNALKDDIVTTQSGLQYRILRTGSGLKPSLLDSVTVNYHGTFIDGSVFDSSVDKGTPASFSLKKVIDGWKEGLPLMQEGAKFQFFIPQTLAYGDRGSGSLVPPYATLCFIIDLLKVSKT